MYLDFRKRLWLVIFVLGLVGGTVCVNCFVSSETVISITKDQFFVDNFSSQYHNWERFIHIGINRIILFIFLVGNALLCRKSLVLYISTAFFGGCFGVVISTVTLAYGNVGIQRLFWYLMPHYVFYIAAFCVVLRFSDCTDSVHRKYGYMLKSAYGGRELLKLIFLILAGIMSECYVNQWLMQYFVKKN